MRYLLPTEILEKKMAGQANVKLSSIYAPIQEETKTYRHHSLYYYFLLHLLPGASIISFYVIAEPFITGAGFSPSFTLMLAFLLIGMPLELGILLFEGIRKNASFTLRGIVVFREPMPAWQYVGILSLLFIFSFGILFLVTPVTNLLATTIFAWLPGYLLPNGDASFVQPARSILLITLIVKLIVDGVVNPIVEELYFRGYLLPRLSGLGWLAPLVNAGLFTLGHFWQPYNYPLIFLTVLVEVYFVWWKRNIYLSILAHCMANSLGALLALAAFFTH